MLKSEDQGMREYVRARVTSAVATTALKTTHALDMYFRAAGSSSRPYVSTTALTSPLPIPKSAKVAIAKNDDTVAHRAYLSLPKYRIVKGTVKSSEARLIARRTPRISE